MSARLCALLGCLLAAAPAGIAFAQAEATEGERISVEHRGTLREVLRAIAEEGGLSLVATGPLDEPAEIFLKDVTAEEALRTVAEGWNLQLELRGRIWTVRARPGTAAPAPFVPAPPAVPAPVPAQTEADAEAALRRAEALDRQAVEAREKARRVREQLQEGLRGSTAAARERVIAGSSSTVERGEVVSRVVVYGGSLRVDGRVLGDVAVFGGSLELGPTALVDGNVTAVGGSVTRHPGAVVGGQVRTMGGSVREAGAKEEPARAVTPPAPVRPPKPRTRLADFLTSFLLLFGLGFAAAMLAPARMKMVQDEIRRAPGKSTLIGFAGALALPALSVLLIITLIGIPILLLIVLPVAFLATAVGLAAVAAELGRRLPVFRGRKSQALVLALGVVAVLLIAKLPVLGPMTVSLFALCGFGAMLRTRFGRGPKVPPSVLRDDLPTGVAV